jgi:hypothetical protein
MIRSVYIAAPWAAKDYAGTVRDRVVAAGIEVTSRWIDFPGDSYDPVVLQTEAYNDWDDVLKADGFFLLNLQKRGEETSGKAVETGIALAVGKPVFMIGEKSNIFQYCDEVIPCEDVDAAISRILSWVN